MVTQGHQNWCVSIRHLWLPININYLVPFLRQTVISVENRKIFHPRVFSAHSELTGFPCSCHDPEDAQSQKSRIMMLSDGPKRFKIDLAI